MNHSYKKHKQLYALLKQTNMHDVRHDIVLSFSNGRTTNSAELSEIEITEMITYLNTLPKNGETKVKNLGSSNIVGKLYYMARLYGYTKYDIDKMKTVVDREALDGWVLKYGYLHKPLNEYKKKELPKLLTQFQCVVSKYIAAL